jgi:hypothetical protein
MLPTSDGGALFACKPNGTFYHVILTKVDQFGEIEWTKQISQTGSSSPSNGIKETFDGNYLLSLASLYPNPGSNGGGGTLVKLNTLGDTLWTRRYADNVTSTVLTDIILTADSNYIMYWEGVSYEGSLNIVKISPMGTLIWSRHYTPNSNFTQLNINSGTELNDGSLVFSGDVALPYITNTEIRSTMIKLDVNGNLVWSKYYNLKNYFESIFKNGNEIRVLSRPHPSYSSLKMSYFKFDENGINYENYSDTTNVFISPNLEDKMSFSNQINDSTYQITIKNYQVGSNSFIIKESGINSLSFSGIMGLTGGNIYTSDGYFFLYGSRNIGNWNGPQLIKTIGNNQPCELTVNSLNWVNDTLFTESNLPLTSSGTLSLIPSLITMSGYQFSVDDGCDSPVGISENEKTEFTIYPNPSSGIIQIESEHANEYTAQVYDFLGNLVYSSKIEKAKEILSLEQFSSGLYTLTITDKNGETNYFKIQISH